MAKLKYPVAGFYSIIDCAGLVHLLCRAMLSLAQTCFPASTASVEYGHDDGQVWQ